ncbi:hypothetical protein E4G67_02710 [Candidatus Bathyarchaeota archaeon]|nr:MAG: hypothetical protein E4G67_02710 [Candidatus Bathyarchaeota archaeon]
MKKRIVVYPRHWWLSCNAFTCYIQTNEKNIVTHLHGGSRNSAYHLYEKELVRLKGKPAKDFSKSIQKKYGGLYMSEFNENGRAF